MLAARWGRAGLNKLLFQQHIALSAFWSIEFFPQCPPGRQTHIFVRYFDDLILVTGGARRWAEVVGVMGGTPYPPVTSGNRACLEGVGEISINLC